MVKLIPNRFLFDFEWPMPYRADPPPLDGNLSGWTDRERLPRLGDLDGERDFAPWWACWNEEGLCLACRVEGKTRLPDCNPARYWKSDNVRLCVNTRPARDVRRGTRYCQQFFFLPTGGGPRKKDPCAGGARLQRARDHAPDVDPTWLGVRSRVDRGGYVLEARVPARALHGFAPVDHPRLGFYLLVEDSELGSQFLTVGDDLNWHVDPSTWITALLSKAPG